MENVFVLISFDVESPYGEYGLSPEGQKERLSNFDYILQVRNLMNRAHIKRTCFILGDYLVQGLAQCGEQVLKNLFEPQNPLVEIAQHTFRHGTVLPIPTRPDRIPMDKDSFRKELQQTNKVIGESFQTSVHGVRMPLGYVNGFKGHQDLTDIIQSSGLKYVNSDSRSKTGDVWLPLVEDGQVRNPYAYANGLLEIPAHGWHDTVFAGRTKTLGRNKNKPWQSQDIFKALIRIFDTVGQVPSHQDLYLSIAFHPWCMRLYDPDLELFSRFLGFMKDLNLTTLTHKELVPVFRTSV